MNLDSLVKKEIIQPKTRARQFYYTGKKFNRSKLKPGVYTGQVTIQRSQEDKPPQKWTLTDHITVLPQ